ncbi:MAG: class I SAM-dependent methyltransferase [Bacteriovoracaceae bacterium]
MSKITINPDDIINYCINHSTLPSSACEEIELNTKKNVHGSQMLIGKLEASFFQFLIQLAGAKKVLELGTYTGYSALTFAEALPSDGKVITVDVNVETVNLAKTYWSKSIHGKKIESIIGEGLTVLAKLNEKFDFIFIDADKANYSNYLEICLTKLNDNGFIAVDNTLWDGLVLDPNGDKQTKAIQNHNKLVSSIKGLHACLIPLRDGIFLIKKRG